MCRSHVLRSGAVAALTVFVSGNTPGSAATRCERLLEMLNTRIVDATCSESTDLTTANPATTPANDSLPGLPPFALTPQIDRGFIAPPAGFRTPITKAVPGLQVQARIANDPLGQARILIRLPDDWNGKLVVAGASGTRSEFNGDFVWSDYVVQKGYAYVSQNKGMYNLFVSSASTRWGAGSIRIREPTFVSTATIRRRCSRAGTRSCWQQPRSGAPRSK